MLSDSDDTDNYKRYIELRKQKKSSKNKSKKFQNGSNQLAPQHRESPLNQQSSSSNTMEDKTYVNKA